jgi:hypothetical protein
MMKSKADDVVNKHGAHRPLVGRRIDKQIAECLHRTFAFGFQIAPSRDALRNIIKFK